MSQDQHQVSIPVPRSARLAVALLFFLNGAVFATWVTRIPAIQSKLLLTPGQLGIALLGTAAGALVAMNLSGFLSARFGSRSVTTIAALCLCAILPLLALAPTLPALVATLVLFGASSGSMDVAMNTQGVAVERRYGRPILNSFHACYSLGGLAGALASGLIASLGLAPLPQFLGVALLFVLLAFAVTRLLLPAEAEAAVGAEGKGVTFALPTRAVLALGLVAFCVVLGEGAMGDWSAVYLTGTLHSGAALAAAGYAAFSIVMAGGRGVGDRLTARLGPMIVVRLGGLVAATGLALALISSWVPTAILGFGLVGAGFSVVFPLTLSAAGRTTKQAYGTAIAAVATCGYMGFLIGPPVIGFIADALSLRIALGVVVVLSLLAAASARAVDGPSSAPQGQVPPAIERAESAIL